MNAKYYNGDDTREFSAPPDSAPMCPFCLGYGYVSYVSHQHPDGTDVECTTREGAGTVSAREAFQGAHVCTAACESLTCPACAQNGLLRCGVTCEHFQMEAA